MSKKEWFVSVKHMQPSELEYYLEAQAANGYILKKLGELAPFYYEFEEGEKTKTKFVVDKTALAKDMYVDTLTGKGWELMGTVGPFYLWRQDYTDKRPKDFTDSAIRGKGYFICDGKYIPIRWSRESDNAQFVFTKEDGTPLSLGRGKTYICVMPDNADVRFAE